MDPFGPLVDAEWLRGRTGDPDVAIVDCRWRLGEPGAGRALHRQDRIPGASFLDVDGDLSDAPGDGAPRGRHPLPAADAFERAARAAGITAGGTVVAYDEAGEGGAARLWWLLRHFGHERAAILDGGLAGWRAEGGPVETGPTAPPAAGDFRARPREDDLASLEEVRERAPAGDRSLVLIDARAPERYAGHHEPVDPVAGHIPAAVNLPFAALQGGGRYLAPEALRERLGAAGVAPGSEAVAYCGSGVSATVLIAAAEHAGIGGVRLYPGSWSEWCRAGLPAEGG